MATKQPEVRKCPMCKIVEARSDGYGTMLGWEEYFQPCIENECMWYCNGKCGAIDKPIYLQQSQPIIDYPSTYPNPNQPYVTWSDSTSTTNVYTSSMNS